MEIQKRVDNVPKVLKNNENTNENKCFNIFGQLSTIFKKFFRRGVLLPLFVGMLIISKIKSSEFLV